MPDKKHMRDEEAKKISDELKEVYKKKIKSVYIKRCGASMDKSIPCRTLEEYLHRFRSTPPDFMIVEFEDGQEVGVLKGKRLFSSQAYHSLMKKIEDAVKNAIYSSPNGIKNEKIDKILPKILFSAVNPDSGEPYLTDTERTLAKELNYPTRSAIFGNIARLVISGQIEERILPGLGRMYFPPEK